jgi:hypothetical protein
MPNEESLSKLAREYVNLRREEEMEKLKHRIADKKVAVAKAAKEAKKFLESRAAEIAHATRNRVPPPPQRDPRRPAASAQRPPLSQESKSSPLSPESNSPLLSLEAVSLATHVASDVHFFLSMCNFICDNCSTLFLSWSGFLVEQGNLCQKFSFFSLS